MFRSNRTIAKSEIDTLSLPERSAMEAQITDQRAAHLPPIYFRNRSNDLAGYIASQPWRQYAFGHLGNLRGQRVLDVACGYSMTPVYMALAGADVWAVDVSGGALDVVAQYANDRGVGHKVHTYQGSAEELPFMASYFDLAFGGAALHHLQLDRFAIELKRVLRVGGKAAFQDPLGENPLLEFIRDRVEYKSRHAIKGTDRPLSFAQVDQFGRQFNYYEFRTFDCLAMIAKGLGLRKANPIRGWLYGLDRGMFKAIPATQRLARFVITCVVR